MDEEDEQILSRLKKIEKFLAQGYVYGGHASQATTDIEWLLYLIENYDIDKLQWLMELEERKREDEIL